MKVKPITMKAGAKTMKHSKVAGLMFALMVFVVVPAAEAQENQPLPQEDIENATAGQRQVTPFTLVNLARRGYLDNFPTLTSLQRADATALVEAGIEQGRVAQETLNDSGYLNAVNLHLKTLFSNNR